MWAPAGAGVVEYVYRPGVGIVRTFPDKGDVFAGATHTAFQSTRGNWVTINSNVTGADVLTEFWTNVNGRIVPLLNDNWQLAWSPNGEDLAAVEGSGYTGTYNWLVMYHVPTHTRKIVQTIPFALPTAIATIQGDIKWSPNGVFVAAMTSRGIIVNDTISDSVTTIPASASSHWGFSDGDLWILEEQNGSTNVRTYGMIDNTGKVFPLVNRQLPWNASNSDVLATGGRVLVEHDNGMVSLLAINSNKLEIQNIANSAGHPWWYDTQNGYFYYGGSIDHTTQTESVQRVHLPKMESNSLVVVYNNHTYIVSSVHIKDVGKEIGTVSDGIAGNGIHVSVPPAGTKLFSLPGVPVDEAIAIEISAGVYLKAFPTTYAH